MTQILTALQILEQFSLVDFNNYTNNSDIEGRALIGGSINSTGGTDEFNTAGGSAITYGSNFAALTVYQSVNTSTRVENGGSAYVGGSGAANMLFNGGGSVTTATPPEAIGNIQTTMDNFSRNLGNLHANSSSSFTDPNNATLTAVPVNGIAIFNLTALQLEGARTLYLVAKGATTIIINVIGGGDINLTTVNLDSSFTASNQSIIWNFATATGVHVGGWEGTILAPYATVTNTSRIEGDVVANSFQGNGEIHAYAYTGSDPTCFLSGTHITTPGGETLVEALRAGDPVLTADGRILPVRWIGVRAILTMFSDPLVVMPIRIRAGALAEQVPTRDLLVSPDHAMFIGGALIHAGALVNGISITREANMPRAFTYYHVELDDHSLILAEGAATETFVDNVDRMAFDNWAEHRALFGDDHTIPEMEYPRAKSPRQVPQAVRNHLAALQSRCVPGRRLVA